MNDSRFQNCNLCYENFNKERKPMVMNCGHTLCSACLNKIKDKCPYCKSDIKKDQTSINFHLISNIDNNQFEDLKSKKINENLNFKIKKLIPFTFKCYKHPDINVINFCSTCEYFQCIECAYECSQSNHIVKYLNKTYCNLYNNFVYSFKDIYGNTLVNGIRNNTVINEKIKLLSNDNKSNGNFEKLINNFDDLNNKIDKQIQSLNSFKKQINDIKSNIIRKMNKFTEECNNLLNEKIVPIVMDCYLNKNSEDSLILNTIYKSTFVYEEKIRLLNKVEDECFVEQGEKEIKEFKNNSSKIVCFYEEIFSQCFDLIESNIKKFSFSNFLKNMDQALESINNINNDISKGLTEELNYITNNKEIRKDIFNTESLASPFNTGIKFFTDKIIHL